MTSGKLMFFSDLFEKSLQTIGRFSITLDPPAMAHITGTLEREAESGLHENVFLDPELFDVDGGGTSRAPGLNTTGMLLDRLSILAVKHWNLVHRAEAPDKAAALRDTQVAEIIQALAEAMPGQSSINNKMTNRSVSAKVDSFAEAYYGLMTTNLLLWEAQEILYNHEIESLPAEELRAYIDFFSRGNITRNTYIQAVDQLYWSFARERVA